MFYFMQIFNLPPAEPVNAVAISRENNDWTKKNCDVMNFIDKTKIWTWPE